MKRLEIALPPLRTIQAYRALFSGHGGVEDARIVRDDLEIASGFRMVTAADASVEETKFSEGQRAVFARVDVLSTISDQALANIEAALAREQEDNIE